ncbi:CLUMA_CG012789, isoform A [Clunio marinus]|uniref:CLUMA_CG012789, isoform A n=1 Tax=Clunio marinus TaxID=568069 RepID=A0A1J1ILF3_9DIPT|nr:CLUMA_CG012789, isoform A [Clunio marinus]
MANNMNNLLNDYNHPNIPHFDIKRYQRKSSSNENAGQNKWKVWPHISARKEKVFEGDDFAIITTITGDIFGWLP